MGLIVVEGFIITTSPVAVYGGVQLPPEEMHRIADQVRRQGVPMLAHHDERHRLKPRLLNVDVRETDSGSLGVWVEFEIDEEAWKAIGDIRGFSATMVEPYREADPDSPKPMLQIASDAGYWDDDLRDEVAAVLSPHFNASSERLYQFNAEPPAKIIVDLAVPLLPLIGSMGINVFSSALWDGLKLFFRPVRRTEPTIISFSAPRDNGRVRFFVRTADAEVAKRALDNLTDIANSSGSAFHYDGQRDRWEEEEE